MSRADRVEGWLYLIRSNRLGLQYMRKRYCILELNLLSCFKSHPHLSHNKDPIRSAVIDSCIRITDNGKEIFQKNTFFMFTLYNNLNQGDHLKLGASSQEEAAKWIKSLREATLKADQNPGNVFGYLTHEWQYLRSNTSTRLHRNMSVDWTLHFPLLKDSATANVAAPSRWTIFACHNGVRLFKETIDRKSNLKQRDVHPALMAACVIDGSSDAIFRILMSLGPSRAEWDFCFDKGNVIDHIDGHTDVVHEILSKDWLHWGMKRRDLLVWRTWRREEDGTYVIFYHSVCYKKCPPQQGYVRALIKCGGYVISPVNQRKHSVVKHMLAVDWKFWKFYPKRYSALTLTIRMLERLAALREFFKEDVRDLLSSRFSFLQFEKAGQELIDDELSKTPSYLSCLGVLEEESDECFDTFEPLGDDKSASNRQSDFSAELNQARAEVQSSGTTDLRVMVHEDCGACNYGSTLPKDPTFKLPCSWSDADPSTYEVRGKTFLVDRKKIKAQGTLMQMVGIDWLRSNKREDDLAGRPGSIVQKYASNGRPEFFFVVNLQVPGLPNYSLAYYAMMSTPVEDVPVLHRFINGDDAYRNSKFKLIPYVSEGPWIVKQTILKRAVVLSHFLKLRYTRGKNYLEIDVDVGSSRLAKNMASLAFGHFSHLVVEMAFLLQGSMPDELPEQLLGAFSINYLDSLKAVLVKP